ncbi:glycosyltransferase family 2 protein [Aequorivita sinensis]|uniref:glycosyltransferase family 2 protein n=1 Tax=Aequorivita sinensis TaxID=1382458 RepID=UPI002300FE70|nr:glycosyltransferase family 2 protein [Aequorivita sinensis]
MVSIIVPNYNHSLYLQERLSSIFNQTYQNFEVIILDDASTDDSLSILNYYKDHPKVSHFIVNEKNSGSPFKQWKKGLGLAQGDYIWIAESDDFCDLNFLESQLESLKHKYMSVAKTIVFSKGKKHKELTHPAFIEGYNVVLENTQILYCPVLNVSATLFRNIDKKKLLGANFAEFRIIGDRVFYHEFFHNKKLTYNGETQSYFRQEDKNLSNLNAKDLNYLESYFKEHVQFINLASDKDKTLITYRKSYITRFFNRVRHRVSRKNKFSFQFLKLYIYYRLQLVSPF